MAPARRLVCAIVALASLAAGCASNGKAPTDDEVLVYGEEKSVVAGMLLAIFPGFFVHGLGVRYAGDRVRANELLEREGFGVVGLAIGAGGVILASQNDEDFFKVSGYVGGGLVGAVGAAFFFESWIRDMMETPDKVRAWNHRINTLRRRPSYPPPEPGLGGPPGEGPDIPIPPPRDATPG